MLDGGVRFQRDGVLLRNRATVGDGNCFWRSLWICLLSLGRLPNGVSDADDTGKQLRQWMSKWLGEHLEDESVPWLFAVTDNGTGDVIEQRRAYARNVDAPYDDTGATLWNNEFDIVAAAMALGLNIHVVQTPLADGDVVHTPRGGIGDRVCGSADVYVLYLRSYNINDNSYTGLHYHALVPAPSDADDGDGGGGARGGGGEDEARARKRRHCTREAARAMPPPRRRRT